MTILIVNTLYYPTKFGGAEKSVQILAEQLVEMGHKVVVSCLTDDKKSVFNHNGVKVYKLLNKNIYWAFNTKKSKTGTLSKIIWHILDTYTNFQKRNILNILKIEKPDLVHVNNISGFSTSILKTIESQKIPILQTLRDYYYLCYKTTCYNQKNCNELCRACAFTSKFKLNNLNNYANNVIGISQFITDKFHKHGLDQTIPITTIYNAVEKSKTNLVRPLQNSSSVTFGYIGSITAAKGVEDMLNTFSLKTLKHFEFKLKIAGKGKKSYIEELKYKYSSIDVEFIGFQNAADFYQSVDALIVPSQWNEPFGRVVIEGAQYNLPIFVSENGALPELKRKLKFIKWFNKKTILEFLQNSNKHHYDYNLIDFSSSTKTKEYEKLYFKIINDEN